MHIDYSAEQKAFKQELRAYMADLMTPELEAEIHATESGGPLYHEALQKMGRDGWLGLGWPTDVGGGGKGPVEEFIFYDEVQRAGFSIPILTLCTVGPTLVRYGTDEQKQQFLPRILEGKLHFSIGYTEPGSGTDLASLTTRAEKDGDHWIVNGQKIFTSQAIHADYLWLAVRTNPDADKHSGISIMIVDTGLPGIEMTPIHTMGENVTSTVHLTDVRVPDSCLVLGEGKGWKLITTQLNHERVALVTIGIVARMLEQVREWALSAPMPGSRTVMDIPWVQASFARMYASVEVLKLLNWQQAVALQSRSLNPADASALKVFGTEFYVECYRALMEILGAAGPLQPGSAGAILNGRVEKIYKAIQVLTFGGGTNEVQRDIISMMGLGMPRAPYEL